MGVCNKQACVQPSKVAVNVTLLAFAADDHAAVAPLLLGGGRRPLLWTDISCPQGAQQQTRSMMLQRTQMGQTDGHPTDT